MRRLVVAALLAVSLALAQEDEETPDSSYPRVFVINFHAEASADSRALEGKLLPRLRTEFLEKDALFVTADLDTPATRNQSLLLMNALG
ncbi:MAG: hypothetical protein ACREID_03480, partial [Planctomycetota bacterium]